MAGRRTVAARVGAAMREPLNLRGSVFEELAREALAVGVEAVDAYLQQALSVDSSGAHFSIVVGRLLDASAGLEVPAAAERQLCERLLARIDAAPGGRRFAEALVERLLLKLAALDEAEGRAGDRAAYGRAALRLASLPVPTQVEDHVNQFERRVRICECRPLPCSAPVPVGRVPDASCPS
jgi:hypothetical protein